MSLMSEVEMGALPSPTTTKNGTGEEKVVYIMRSRIEPDPTQPRQWFDEVKLQELATSIGAVGQKVAIIVVEHPYKPSQYLIVDGERRWRACGMAGVDRMKAEVSSETDSGKLFMDSAIVNFGREGHTTLEIMYALARIKKDFPKLKNAKIAGSFGKSLAWVQNHLALLRLPEEVQQLMHPSRPRKQRLVVSVALQLVTLPERDQIRLAHEFCEGKRSAKSATVAIVRHRLTTQGGTNIKKPRRSHARQKITGFAARMHEETELMASVGEEGFMAAFEGCEKREVIATIDNIESAEKYLSDIKSLLQDVLDKK